MLFCTLLIIRLWFCSLHKKSDPRFRQKVKLVMSFFNFRRHNECFFPSEPRYKKSTCQKPLKCHFILERNFHWPSVPKSTNCMVYTGQSNIFLRSYPLDLVKSSKSAFCNDSSPFFKLIFL